MAEVVEKATETANEVKDQAIETIREVSPWVIRLARFGFTTKGIVYILLGFLAFQAAMGFGSAEVDQKDVLITLLQQPLGRIILLVVSMGLLGYVAWRIVQAIVDPEDEGTSPSGLLKRLGYGISAGAYTGLAFSAFRLGIGGGLGQELSVESLTRAVMVSPSGRWFIGLIGAGVIVVGLAQVYQAYRARFDGGIRDAQVHSQPRHWLIPLGRLGYTSRGIIYILMGGLLIRAAWKFDPESAGGLGEALQEMAFQPYGPWLLAVVAAGLVAYGAYAIGLGLYRRLYLQ